MIRFLFILFYISYKLSFNLNSYKLQNYYDRIILYSLYDLFFHRRIGTNSSTNCKKQFTFFEINNKRKREVYYSFYMQFMCLI